MNLTGLFSSVRNDVEALRKGVEWVASSRLFRFIVSFTAGSTVYLCIQAILTGILGFLDDVTSALNGLNAAASAIDSSWLDRVNYFFPLDTFATVVLLYVSIWSAVEIFKSISWVYDKLGQLVEKIPVVQ